MTTPGGCEFNPRLRRTFFPAYFRLSPLQKHVKKVVGGFGKKSRVSTGVRKPGNTYVLNSNTTNQLPGESLNYTLYLFIKPQALT